MLLRKITTITFLSFSLIGLQSCSEDSTEPTPSSTTTNAGTSSEMTNVLDEAETRLQEEAAALQETAEEKVEEVKDMAQEEYDQLRAEAETEIEAQQDDLEDQAKEALSDFSL